jgi:glucose-1-phosphate cytidylyltransferase
MPTSKARDLPVVILCGGMGTRLREETEHRPKPMVEIGEQPILWHIMKIYGAAGVHRFVLCLGYKSWEIKQYFLRYHEKRLDFTMRLDGKKALQFREETDGSENWEVTLAETGLDTATGARIKRVERYLDTDTFFLTYGDAVADLDVDALLAFHRSHGKIATVTGVRPTSRYGEMTVEDDGRVVEFHEKPRDGMALVSGGFFVFERRFLDYLGHDPQLFFELEPLQRLAREGELVTYVHEGAWFSMDTYRDYLQLNRIWNEGAPPWKIWA